MEKKFNPYSQLYRSIKGYITWNNTKIIDSSLGYLSPLEMEIKSREIINKAA